MNIKEELKKPGVKRVILDTDTYNEIDDQFALALSMLAEDRINLVCVTAAPFHNEKSNSFADGMERSYREIGICTSLVAKSHGTKVPPYYRGSTERMPDESTPVDSEAAHAIARHIMESDETTYVVAIGAITNVASAVLLHPEIKDKIAVIWLGANAKWFCGGEFNLNGDVNAANSLFASGVPFLLFPCGGVVSHLILNIYELVIFSAETPSLAIISATMLPNASRTVPYRGAALSGTSRRYAELSSRTASRNPSCRVPM